MRNWWCAGARGAISSMQYSHNGRFLLSTDDGGQVKYWKPNLELVKVRGFCRSP